jgi:hypothetical protein
MFYLFVSVVWFCVCMWFIVCLLAIKAWITYFIPMLSKHIERAKVRNNYTTHHGNRKALP